MLFARQTSLAVLADAGLRRKLSEPEWPAQHQLLIAQPRSTSKVIRSCSCDVDTYTHAVNAKSLRETQKPPNLRGTFPFATETTSLPESTVRRARTTPLNAILTRTVESAWRWIGRRIGARMAWAAAAITVLIFLLASSGFRKTALAAVALTMCLAVGSEPPNA